MLIYQIPQQTIRSSEHTSGNIALKTDQDFLQMFQRYACLMSSESYHRISAFAQDDPTYPRWLIVQEFVDPVCFNDSVAQKKREAEWWWRQDGWEGILVEFFGVKDNEKQIEVRLKHRSGAATVGEDY